jgi:amidase
MARLLVDCLSQETIFAADGGHDYRTECEKSGEPLIQTMSPTTDAHESALDEPLVKSLIGPSYPRSAYEACSCVFQIYKAGC